MSGLLHQLAPRLIAISPPGSLWDTAKPVSHSQADGLLIHQRFEPIHGIEIAPVVATGGDHTPSPDGLLDPLAQFHIQSDRLLHIEVDASLNGLQFLIQVGEGRNTDVDRVQPLPLQHLVIVGVDRAPELLLSSLGPFQIEVAESYCLRLFDLLQPLEVELSDISCANEADADCHADLL